ncbi:hypothetical protein ACS0TY_014840 [Phlomoides rotata]
MVNESYEPLFETKKAKLFATSLEHKFDSDFTGSSPRLTDGTASTGKPSRTGSHTADLTIEPPTMVINTILSVMAYDYPPEKLSVYLSDDAAFGLTFYALVEASHFAEHWVPFCREFKVKPRSLEAYFRTK